MREAGEGVSAANDAASVARPSAWWVRWGIASMSVVAIAALLFGTQTIWYYKTFAPRIDEANQLLYDLVVESSQRNVYRSISRNVDMLERSGVSAEDETGGLSEAWSDFQSHFSVAPAEAIDLFRSDLSVFGASAADATESIETLREALRRLEELYVDPYKQLLEDLENPPLYLWPTAHVLTDRSGYRDSLILNRSIHLAQVGDIGTARIMLGGLQASSEDSQMRGVVYYMLGRLQFEIFRSRPEVEHYTLALQYLRDSLKIDPDSQMARRFLDYILSLDLGYAAPRPGEGRPTTQSDGEGAAISSHERRF